MYVITNSGKLFDGEFTEWFIESGFIQYQCQMSINYKYAPDGTKIVFYFILMTFSIFVLLNLLEMSCGHSRKDIPCKLLGICTFIHVNHNFLDEGPFHFSRSG